MTTLREQLEAKIERDDSYCPCTPKEIKAYRAGARSLLELVVKLDEALRKIDMARFENQNKEMGDLLLYKSEVAKEAREELKRWVKS